MTSFFRFVNKRASYQFGIISLAHGGKIYKLPIIIKNLKDKLPIIIKKLNENNLSDSLHILVQNIIVTLL
jgi:hypothetical protein